MPAHHGHECSGTGQVSGCSAPTKWCYSHKCYSKSDYEDLVDADDPEVFTLEESAVPSETSAEQSDLESTVIKVTYSSEEADALLKRFGSSSTAEELIQNFIDTQVAELASTTMQIEYNFKKSKFPTLSEKNLSAFETDEADQGIDIEVTMTQTTSKSGTSY